MLFNTRLNLLSKSKRQRLEILTKFIFVRDILEIAFLIYTILAITLLWSWLILQEDFNNLAESSTLVNREYSKYNQEIKNVNSLIKKFNTASQLFTPLSPQLATMITTLPADIKINTLNIDRIHNQVIVAGTALTRNALLAYQKQLKESGWLKDVETPTSQLFQRDNISFEIKAILTDVNKSTVTPASSQ